MFHNIITSTYRKTSLPVFHSVLNVLFKQKNNNNNNSVINEININYIKMLCDSTVRKEQYKLKNTMKNYYSLSY